MASGRGTGASYRSEALHHIRPVATKAATHRPDRHRQATTSAVTGSPALEPFRAIVNDPDSALSRVAG